MNALTLKIAIARTPYTEALFNGTVVSDRVSFDFVDVKPITRAFRRMARTLEFDACEMALATLAVAHRYDIPVTGVPAVLLREYPLPHLVCLRDAPISQPSDLRGRRIAVRAYSQTTAVWIRGLLETEYGVKPDEVTWLTQEDSHVAQLGPQPSEQSLAPDMEIYDALVNGVADAAITLHLGSHPNIRTVIPDAGQAMRDWFARHQAQPINHLVVVKSELLREHDWLAAELTTLFARARSLKDGSDPAPFSRAGAALLLQFCALQGLTPIAYGPESLIAGA
ncbi:MAG TPA: ABC transporter substrate-binding protein [Bordetella sp.]|jgi:4,5-dihydroxyphthalate decarboxylase|nr:ABC transporter substrate-binding protein [Bordetella sp.]